MPPDNTVAVASREIRFNALPFVGHRPIGVGCSVDYRRLVWLPIPKMMPRGMGHYVNFVQTRRCGHGLRYWPGGDHCAHGFRLAASTLLNEEGAFDGDVVEAQLAHDTEKKAPAARRGGAAPAWNGRQEQDPRHL